jgi:hypothetical protein
MLLLGSRYQRSGMKIAIAGFRIGGGAAAVAFAGTGTT